jgi:hypothetical protein
MPSLPRVWGREVIRALEKLGFVVRRQRGSLVILPTRGDRVCRPGPRGIVGRDLERLAETGWRLQGRVPGRPRLASGHISACRLNDA